MKPSYFELADGARARPCVAKPSKDDKGLPPPLRALMPYARVLQAEKLIGSAHADRPSRSGL